MNGPADGAGCEMPSDIHPDRILACFSTVRSPVVIAHLVDEPRFAARLKTVVTRHYDLSVVGEDSGPADLSLAALSVEELEAIAFRAGVVVNARAFLREIRGPMLAALGERFGMQALEDARRHSEMAAERMPSDDIVALEKAVQRDGRACLGAWIAALPEATGRHVRLKWPDDAAVPPAAALGSYERGAEIMRLLNTDREVSA